MFLIAGLLIWRRGRAEFGILTVLVGVGSFVAHGPRWPGAEWLHDVTLAWVLLAIATDGLPRRQRWSLLGVIGALFAVAPVVADPISVILAGWAIVRELTMRIRRPVKAMGIAGIGAGLGTISRTGSPLCDPDSLLQGHGIWHVLAAFALFVWADGTPEIR